MCCGFGGWTWARMHATSTYLGVAVNALPAWVGSSKLPHLANFVLAIFDGRRSVDGLSKAPRGKAVSGMLGINA